MIKGIVRPIVLYGDPVLRAVSSSVKSVSSAETQQWIADLRATLKAVGGLGLAAPQIGIPKRLFAVQTKTLYEAGKAPLIDEIFINPALVKTSPNKETYEEGCLSIPTIHEDIVRPSTLKLRYTNPKAKTLENTFEGWIARIIQHEYDHIEGILFLDHLSRLRMTLLKKKLARIRKGEVETNYAIRAWNSH